MKTIWKYPLPGPFSTIDVPIGAMFLTAKMQGIYPTLWALVDPTAEKKAQRIAVIPTGGEFEDDWEFIASIFPDPLVFHVFKVPNKGDTHD